jgi:hypothetical protein
MVFLDRFNLVSLKEIYNILKCQNYFHNIKTYQLCKFDIIVLLRNTQLFDETIENYLLFYNSQERKWIKLTPHKKLYDRGEKMKCTIFEKNKTVINFF